MPESLVRKYPYPASGVAPDVPYWLQRLADSLDVDIAALYPKPFTALTLTNGWLEYTGGGGYRNGLWVRKAGNSLHINGMIRAGALNSIMATITDLNLVPTTGTIFEADAAGSRATILLSPKAAVGQPASPQTGQLTYRSGPANPSYLMINEVIPLD